MPGIPAGNHGAITRAGTVCLFAPDTQDFTMAKARQPSSNTSSGKPQARPAGKAAGSKRASPSSNRGNGDELQQMVDG